MMEVVVVLCVLVLAEHAARGQDKMYNFREEEPEGTFIGNIALDLNLAALIPQDVFSNLHYGIMNWEDGGQFRVDEKNSGLFTKNRLDREQLCRFETRCELKLRVAARSETSIKKYTIYVSLLDINDNSPKFNESVFTLQLPESVTVGKEYTLPGAHDDDRGLENSIQSYALVPSSDAFSVVYFKQLDGTSDVRLVVKKTLDREVRDFYSLVLVAKDGGNPVRSASMEVKIQVTDDNDSTPRFTESQYSVQIGENTPSGAAIITLTAEDDDIGANAALEYRLSARQEASTTKMFQIDRKTGQLRANSPLTSGSYTLIVEAVDSGSPQRVNQTEVQVTVIDTENNPPVITIDVLSQDSKYAHVSETANKNTLVAHVSVFDPDSGPNGIVLCYSQSAFFDLHALGDNDYILVVVRRLDREQTSEYKVALFCEDSGTPRLNTTQLCDVIVDDSNDNAPVFEETNQKITLYEGNVINDVALILKATDKDIGINAKLYFSLLNDSNGFFKIPIGSNTLVCAKRLDRETQDNHIVEVVVRDGGTPALSATTTVTIQVLDINDVVPQFLHSSYKFSISEGQPAGSFVGVVSASDLDLAEGGDIEFSLPKLSTESAKFQIQRNGTLKTLTPLDREGSSIYTFSVQAADRGRPRLSSQVEIQVEVTDINDNAPVFLFPSPSNNSITLTLPVDTSKVLLRLQVIDADEGENGEVYFTLQPGNASRLFYVDAITGELFANRVFSSDDIGMHNLTLTATDRGTVPLYTTKHMIVQVTNSGQHSVQIADTKAMVVSGLVCGTVMMAVIILALVCYVKRRAKGKPLRYLDNKKHKSAPSVINAATPPNQYINHKEPNKQIKVISCDDTITTDSDYSAHTLDTGFTEPYNTHHYLGILETVDLTVSGEDPETNDKELNRVTSLRLQQAFQHISSFKSRLITPLDTSKPYEWREIRIPGQAGDFGSLSSRCTSSYNHNGDSGVGTDDDAVFLPRRLSPSRRKRSDNSNHASNHASNTRHQYHPRYTSRPSSDVSTTSSSEPSSSSLPSLCSKPMSDSAKFRAASARTRDMRPSDSMDDQCTTTSGSYSINLDDHRGEVGKGERGGCSGASLQSRKLERIHDIYV